MRIDPRAMTILGGMGGKGPGGAVPQGKGGGVPYVTEREFESEVIRSEIPVLMEFSADWCQPCKAIDPDVQAFAREMEGRVKVVKIDVDKSPVIAQQLRVQSVPTFMVVAEGRIQDAVVGAIRKKKMQEMLDPFLPRAAGALHDVVSGSNGLLCLGNPMCSARAGYDGPSGLGTPSGLAAF